MATKLRGLFRAFSKARDPQTLTNRFNVYNKAHKIIQDEVPINKFASQETRELRSSLFSQNMYG